MRIALLGGDARQVYLAKLLANRGHDLCGWGLDAPDLPRCDPEQAGAAEVIVLVNPLWAPTRPKRPFQSEAHV